MNTTYDIQMKSLASRIGILEKIGFKIQFQSRETGIESLTTHRIYSPEEITVVNSYRFEGEPTPQQYTIVYAIETNNGERGIIIDTHGAEQ